jgi:hypothetical protein
MIAVSIYNKSTGQIIQNRSVVSLDEIILPNTLGYVEGTYTIFHKKWNGTQVVDYAIPYISNSNTFLVRSKRNTLLAQSDWTQMPDSALTDSKKAEWATYRQALRDMMASYTDSESNTVENTTFPTQPS